MPSVYVGGGGARLIDQSQLQGAFQRKATHDIARERNQFVKRKLGWEQEDRDREAGYRKAATEFYKASVRPLLEEDDLQQIQNATGAVGPIIPRARYDSNGLYFESPQREVDRLARTATMEEAFSKLDPKELPRARETFQGVLDDDEADERAMRMAQQYVRKVESGAFLKDEPGAQGELSDEDQAIQDNIMEAARELSNPDRQWTKEELDALQASIFELETDRSEQRTTRIFRDQEVARAEGEVAQGWGKWPDSHQRAALAEIDAGRQDKYDPANLFRKVQIKQATGNLEEYFQAAIKGFDPSMMTPEMQSFIDMVHAMFGSTPQRSKTAPAPPPDPKDPNTPPPPDVVDPATLPKDIRFSKFNELAEIFAEGGLTLDQIDEAIMGVGLDPELLTDEMMEQIKRQADRIRGEYKQIQSDIQGSGGATRSTAAPGEKVPGYNPRGRTGPGWKTRGRTGPGQK